MIKNWLSSLLSSLSLPDLMSETSTEPTTSTSTPPRKKIKLENKTVKHSDDKNPVKESKNENLSLLKSLVPSLSESSLKISKAGQLMKAADHIQELQQDNETLGREIEMLKSSSQSLLKDISGFQNQLACKSSQGPSASTNIENGDGGNSLHQLYSNHSLSCTQQNWKYWIFSRMMKPLLESFDRSVSNQSIEDLSRTTSSWLDQHVNLVQLRPLVTESLKVKWSVIFQNRINLIHLEHFCGEQHTHPPTKVTTRGFAKGLRRLVEIVFAIVFIVFFNSASWSYRNKDKKNIITKRVAKSLDYWTTNDLFDSELIRCSSLEIFH